MFHTDLIALDKQSSKLIWGARLFVFVVDLGERFSDPGFNTTKQDFGLGIQFVCSFGILGRNHRLLKRLLTAR